MKADYRWVISTVWNTPKTETQRSVVGYRTSVIQTMNGKWYLVANRMKLPRRTDRWDPVSRNYIYDQPDWSGPGEPTSGTKLEITPDTVDMLIDALIAIKEMMSSGKTLKDAFPPSQENVNG